MQTKGTTMTAYANEIADLNEAARTIQTTKALSPSDALCHLINIRGLEEVAVDGNTAVYRLESGRLVNCWFEGAQTDEIAEGGTGFDDQIEWMNAA
jgi:hypothetical protein